MQKAELIWNGRMAFTASTPSGAELTLDTTADQGGDLSGPSPIEAFLCAMAACAGMDVVGILSKMRQDVAEYRIEVEWERSPAGEWPRPVTKVVMHHFFKGEGLDPEKLAKAISLSDEKYCGVLSTIRSEPDISSTYKIEP